jgi:hypothetical protein
MTNAKFPMFLNDWSEDYIKGQSWRDEDETPLKQMASDFEEDIEYLQSLNILVASYTYECYEGDAFVLFEKDGKLYEVNGGHCSCYGLEGQFEPEEVVLDELEHRLTKGGFGKERSTYDFINDEYEMHNVFAEELLEVVRQHKSQSNT